LSTFSNKWIIIGVLSSCFSGLSAQSDLSSRDFLQEFDSSHSTFTKACIIGGYDTSKQLHWRAQFSSTAYFKSDTFLKELDCYNVHFPNDVSFDQSIINGVADFSNDTFNSDAVFTDVKFLDQARFTNAIFQNTADFSYTIFRKSAIFSNIGLTDTTELDFYKSTFPDTLDFSDISPIPREINLSKGVEYDTCLHHIYIEGSDISKFRLDYHFFKLLFVDPKPPHLPMTPDQIDGVYENLLKNFQERGQLESYTLLDIEFNDYQWSKKPFFVARWFHFFPHYWNAYGHDNARVFLWAGFFLLLFTCITYRHLEHLVKDVYLMTNVKDFKTLAEIKMIPKKTDRFREYLERFWNSLVFTSTIFFLFSLSINRFKFKYKRAAFYLLVVYTVGIICIAYMANFVINR
jgi:hypothetical protein